MGNRIVVSLAALFLAACETSPVPGPYAPGVSADAPRDTVGILFSWTPEQTIVNFRNIDRIFATHTVRHGDRVPPTARSRADRSRRDTGGDRQCSRRTSAEHRPADVAEQDDRRHRGEGRQIVLERYAFDRSPDDRWTAMSVTKIFTSTLIGYRREGWTDQFDRR